MTLIAGVGHCFLGSVETKILVSLLVGSIPGIVASSFFANNIPERILRPLLAGTLSIVGFRLAI